MTKFERTFEDAGIMTARILLVRFEWFTEKQVAAMSDKQVWREIFIPRRNVMNESK